MVPRRRRNQLGNRMAVQGVLEGAGEGRGPSPACWWTTRRGRKSPPPCQQEEVPAGSISSAPLTIVESTITLLRGNEVTHGLNFLHISEGRLEWGRPRHPCPCPLPRKRQNGCFVEHPFVDRDYDALRMGQLAVRLAAPSACRPPWRWHHDPKAAAIRQHPPCVIVSLIAIRTCRCAQAANREEHERQHDERERPP